MKSKESQEYFFGEENIILAFIFGSIARGFGGEDSDLDIDVYLKNEDEGDRIWLDLCRITKREIDLVLLNKASASLISNIFKTGIPLAIKDKNFTSICIEHPN